MHTRVRTLCSSAQRRVDLLVLCVNVQVYYQSNFLPVTLSVKIVADKYVDLSQYLNMYAPFCLFLLSIYTHVYASNLRVLPKYQIDVLKITTSFNTWNK
mmetsp:Transcript_64599/g.75790  ORF Transcript_64599/g.75790 Transcript_64599/m.75790 type:complete len:99 (+) Transcript_64599:1135-1431(+)